ncbi:hypothetical protein H311_04005, partial [Anncaliia algerae PRA109]
SSKPKYSVASNDHCKTHTFTITPAGTDVKITRSIRELQATSDPKLMNWIEEFRELVSLNAWSDQTAVLILKAIVSKEVLEVIKSKQTIDTCLDLIIATEFEESKRFYYEDKINKIKQYNYYLIQEYFNELQQAFQNYCFCTRLNSKEQNYRLEEYFYKGLCPTTKIELEKIGIKGMENIISRLQRIETILLEEKTINHESDRVIGTGIKPNNSLKIKDTKRKYCNYHKSTRHDNSECYKQKESKQDHKGGKSYQMKEQFPDNNVLNTVLEINDQNYNAILDTGASSNYISIDLAKQMGKNEGFSELAERCELGNGNETKIIGKVEFSFHLKNFNNLKCCDSFKIIEGNFQNIILGNAFLSKYKVKIDYDYMIINIDNNLYSPANESFEEWNQSPDRLLVEKACTLTEMDYKYIIK